MTRNKVAVIGTINFDSVTRLDRSRVQSYGGIIYNLQVLAQLVDSETSIFPVANVGFDHERAIRALLALLPHTCENSVRSVKAKNNHCHLRYSSAADKTEVLRGWVGGVSRRQLEEIFDSQIILVNFISGSDISTNNLLWLRSRTRGTIYMDFHSRTLGRRSNGERFLRRPRDWKETVGCADILQLNDIEFRLLAGAEPGPEACEDFVRRQMSASAQGLLVTLGESGCLAVSRERKRLTVESIATTPPAKVVDTTGCGDIFAGAFLAAWLRGLRMTDAARFAVKLATFRVSRPDLDEIDFASAAAGLKTDGVAF